MASRASISALLPLRGGDPPAPARCVPTEESQPDAILACADTLGIPWRRLLIQEIEAEQRLRSSLPDAQGDDDLEPALAILTACALRSWRVRDRLETLGYQARVSARGARTRLRAFVRLFAGESGPDPAALVRHCGFAHQRILLLQRARRAAARSRGTTEERLAIVCAAARCSFEDAEWALREDASPRRGRRLEAAVRKVREEGFFVPRAATEARSLRELRRIVAAASGAAFRQGSRSGFRDAASRNRRGDRS